MQPPIDSGTLWELHLAVAANDRARGDQAAAARSMRSARAHAAARKIIKRMGGYVLTPTITSGRVLLVSKTA